MYIVDVINSFRYSGDYIELISNKEKIKRYIYSQLGLYEIDKMKQIIINKCIYTGCKRKLNDVCGCFVCTIYDIARDIIR